MAPISSTSRCLVRRDDGGCSGWECYNSTKQAGIVFMAIIVPVVAGVVLWYGLVKPNLSYWQSVSREAKQRQKMEKQIREDALRQLSSSPSPAGPPQEHHEHREEGQNQPPQEEPLPQQEAPLSQTPPARPSPSDKSAAGSRLKLHAASEAPRVSYPATTDNAPLRSSPKSRKSQQSTPPKAHPGTDRQPAGADASPSSQKTCAEPEFQWEELKPEKQQPGHETQVPRMPFPPFTPFAPSLQRQNSQHWQQQPCLQPSFHPFLSILPPPPPPPRFAPMSQMPGSFPAPTDPTSYHAPLQPTYAPSGYTTVDNGRQPGPPASFTTKSTSFPWSLFSRSRKSGPSPKARTESDLGLERAPSGDREVMSLSPEVLPSETSSGGNNRHEKSESDSENETDASDKRRRLGGRRYRERSRGHYRRRTMSEGSRDEHGRRRHGTRHLPHATRRHGRRRPQRESSRSCSPDRNRLQERPKSPKRSRLAFLAPLVPLALGALGVVTEARARENRERLQDARAFSARHRSLSAGRGAINTRRADRGSSQRRRSMADELLEGAVRALDGAQADSASDTNGDTAHRGRDRRARQHRIRYRDLENLRGGYTSSDTRVIETSDDEQAHGGGSGTRRRARRGAAWEEEGSGSGSGSGSNSGSTMCSTYWRFRDSDSLRRHGSSESDGKRS